MEADHRGEHAGCNSPGHPRAPRRIGGRAGDGRQRDRATGAPRIPLRSGMGANGNVTRQAALPRDGRRDVPGHVQKMEMRLQRPARARARTCDPPTQQPPAVPYKGQAGTLRTQSPPPSAGQPGRPPAPSLDLAMGHPATASLPPDAPPHPAASPSPAHGATATATAATAAAAASAATPAATPPAPPPGSTRQPPPSPPERILVAPRPHRRRDRASPGPDDGFPPVPVQKPRRNDISHRRRYVPDSVRA